MLLVNESAEYQIWPSKFRFYGLTFERHQYHSCEQNGQADVLGGRSSISAGEQTSQKKYMSLGSGWLLHVGCIN